MKKTIEAEKLFDYALAFKDASKVKRVNQNGNFSTTIMISFLNQSI